MNKLNHVAIIMDGNGRWGLKKKGSRNYGHLKGIKTVENIISASVKNNISFLTLYTFSTENWKRPKQEINFLFDLIRISLNNKFKKIVKQGVKVNIIGSKKGLPDDIKKIIKFIESKTLNNKRITLKQCDKTGLWFMPMVSMLEKTVRDLNKPPEIPVVYKLSLKGHVQNIGQLLVAFNQHRSIK